jgi:hypothetical protein
MLVCSVCLYALSVCDDWDTFTGGITSTVVLHSIAQCATPHSPAPNQRVYASLKMQRMMLHWDP